MEPIFPAVAQPPMRREYVGPGSQPLSSDQVNAVIDNRTGLPDDQVREAIQDRWVETAGLQFAQPSNFQIYSNMQSSMLARTPFRTPGNVIDEIKLARAIADTDDDVAATMGLMSALAYGEGLQNHHRDESTLEFFNQMTGLRSSGFSTISVPLIATLEEMHREYMIAGSVTTLTLFTRSRMSYFPLKSDEPVKAQLQVPHVGVLPAESIRVISNDVMGMGRLAYYTEDMNFRRWLDEFLDPNTPGARRAMMRLQEPVAAALFTGRFEVPMTDDDINTRGKVVYLLNDQMVHRTSMPKGALPYARPLLTRNFALLEAKRLLNIMDYALLQGGTNYIVVAKKGTDHLPAEQPEIENLVHQVTHASRSGVMVGDHRLTIEIITPDLKELLNPEKRKLLGRKVSMAMLRQSEQVTGDPGTQGAVNEMELLARVVSADRTKMLNHAETTFYADTGLRNRSVFKQGPPTIWGPKIILAGAKDFWSMVLNSRDRGDIPRRWAVEALGYNYEAGLAERQREIARGDDEILTPGDIPFSNPGEPQDNGPGRPRGTSTNNGRGRDTPGQGRDPAAPNRVIRRTAGETVKAVVDGTEVSYVGETTLALFADVAEIDFGYVTEVEREAIEGGRPVRNGKSIIVPVNVDALCTAELRTAKLEDGLRVVIGERLGDEAVIARALRFTEPHYDLKAASEYALRWGFAAEPLAEAAAQCLNCGAEIDPGTKICPNCGMPAGGSAAGDGDSDVAEIAKRRRRRAHAAGQRFCVGCGLPVLKTTATCPNCGMDPDGDGDVDPAGGGDPGPV